MTDTSKQTEQGLSYDTKTILTVVLLFLAYPVGIILMYKWMNWPGWLKFILAIPVWLMLIAFVGIFLVGFLATVNPSAQINKAKEKLNENQSTQTQEKRAECKLECSEESGSKILACVESCMSR